LPSIPTFVGDALPVENSFRWENEQQAEGPGWCQIFSV
jgi:hypothetical protein